MRFVALAALLACVAFSQRGYYPKAWVDLFQPPYENCPEIMMSVGCVSEDVCYIPGGSNGVGFAVYKFDGKWNGNFSPLEEVDNVPIDFVLEIGVGGTAAAPKGAAGGAGLLYGLKYFVNASALAPADTVPSTETMDIRTDKTGEKVLLVDGFTEKPTLMFSTDAGKTYTTKEVKATVANTTCTLPNYQAIVDENTWYVVLGSFPEHHHHHHNSKARGPKAPVRYFNEHTAFLKRDTPMEEAAKLGFSAGGKKNPRRLKRSMLKEHKEWVKAGSPSTSGNLGICPYSAAIAKTTDGGSTWTTHQFNTTTWTLNDIDCKDATHCLTVGAGFKEDPGAVVLRTTDGETWHQVLFLPSEGGAAVYALNAVRWNPANPMEAWVAGGLESQAGNQAIFYYTKDGGDTWHVHGEVNFVAEVMQMSFVADGTGFAVGITQFDDSTILRYTANGPPATPAPTWNGNFTQKQCDDNDCSVNCTEISLPQNTCLNLTGGGSAKAHCDMTDQVLIQDVFPIDQVCWGPAAPQPMPLNVCLEAGGGGSFMNLCGSMGGKQVAAHEAKIMRPKKQTRKL